MDTRVRGGDAAADAGRLKLVERTDVRWYTREAERTTVRCHVEGESALSGARCGHRMASPSTMKPGNPPRLTMALSSPGPGLLLALVAVPSERVSSAAGDSGNPDLVAEALAGLRNQLPLARALGFNGVETYVRWGWVERQRGRLGPSGDYGEAQYPAKGPGMAAMRRKPSAIKAHYELGSEACFRVCLLLAGAIAAMPPGG